MRLFKGATRAPTLEVISAPAKDGVRLAKCLPAEGEGPTCRGCGCGQVFTGGAPAGAEAASACFTNYSVSVCCSLIC